MLKRNGHEQLPKDSRSFLFTPRKVVTEKMGDGSFWYGGIKHCLEKVLQLNKITPDPIPLNFNMDGLPLHKSSKTEFWPILMSIATDTKISPMVVAIYSGVGKPPSAEIYLKKFVDELTAIVKDGFPVNSSHCTVSINAFVCDTPARCYLKCMYDFNI